MSREPDSCSAQALLAGRLLLSGLLLAGWKNVNGCNYSSLAWKISKRTENCWPRLPPSSKTLGPFQDGANQGKWTSYKQRELNAKSWALIFKITTSSLSGGSFYSPNKPSTMKVALKRKRKAIPRSYFFKGSACVFILEDFNVYVCFSGGWGDLLTKVEKNLGGKPQNTWEPIKLVLMMIYTYILTRYAFLLIYFFLKIEPLHSIYFFTF